MKEIVLFASGSGSNVENIAEYFENHRSIRIRCVLTNKTDAQVISRCERLKLPILYFNRVAFSKSGVVLEILKGLDPDLIVLAGFLWKVPENWVRAYPKKIVNIHPALLPKYGGKGMYGNAVHEAVKNNRENETGITIHYVDEHYDQGAIIHQEKVELSSNDSPAQIAQKVHELEYQYFPRIIEKLLMANG